MIQETYFDSCVGCGTVFTPAFVLLYNTGRHDTANMNLDSLKGQHYQHGLQMAKGSTSLHENYVLFYFAPMSKPSDPSNAIVTELLSVSQK